MRNSLLLVAGLAAGTMALPSSSHIVHERRTETLTHGWEKREAADPNAMVPVRIALKQSNIDKGDDYLMEVSDPESPKYGQHYTKQEVMDMFAPTEETINSVKNWLVKSGIPEDEIILSNSKGWMGFETTVSNLESVLKTKYHVYNNVAARSNHLGTDEYSLPEEISDLVDFIMPAVSTGKMNKRDDKAEAQAVAIKEPVRELTEELAKAIKVNTSTTSICDQIITPQCIKALYGITEAELSNITNPMGMFESLGDVYSQEDLDKFFSLVAPNIPQGTGPKLDLINGATAPNRQQDAGGESDLDFDMAYPIIYPQTMTLFQVRSDYDIFIAFLDAIDGSFCSKHDRDPNEMCDTFDPTSVISVSYGGNEHFWDAAFLKRQCNEFMKLGLLGITVVVASGDDGVAATNGYCLGPHHDIFAADNPSGCPYITSVGSTLIPPGGKIGDANVEVATTRFSSGGGFSNVFTTPKWQSNAVGNYLLRHNPNYFSYITQNGVIPNDTRGIYNRGGRAYPDIAALGDNGLVVTRGQIGLSGGTSMSAPIVAAIVNRINEERLNLGKGPVGFINPALYGAYDKEIPLFNDVLVGNQHLGGAYGARYPSACGNDGFSCVEGWDPVTGLGTPRFKEMVKYFIEI